MRKNQPLLFFKSNRELRPVSHQADQTKEVVFKRGILPGVLQCARTTFQPGAIVSAHSHDSMAELFHVITGSLLLKVDGAQHFIKAGDAFLIPSKCIHAFDIVERTDVIYMNFEMESLPPMA